MEMIDRVRKTIDSHHMLPDNGRVLIGLSGGPDSVCLAVILQWLREEFSLSLSAVYIDHGLRPEETQNEIVFCRNLCGALHIDFFEKEVNAREFADNKGLNLQEAARALRYRVFEDISEQINADRVALGHNADDQAETVLMRLFRGSGRRGLSGIPPVRNLEFSRGDVTSPVQHAGLRVNKNILIIRPLIEIGRKEIEKFLEGAIHELPLQADQPFILDSSNLKEEYSRNWIRLSLLSEIKKKHPSVVYDMCRTADIFREEDEYLELKVTKTLMRLISRKSDESIELFLAPLQTIERPLLRRVLRRAIDETWGLRGISYQNIEDIMHLIKKGRSGDRIILPEDVRVVKDYSLLKISTETPPEIGEYELHIPGEATVEEINTVLSASLEENSEGTYDGRSSVLLDAEAVTGPLKVRRRKEGDLFYPLGFGKKKKLQDYFTDEKVPRDRRNSIPIVLSGNDIIWVAGHRADERFKVTDKTKTYLKLTISRR